ncbi:hypothetical protein [Sciscionella marina]|uniref:hypothetical protein n=1 Tax=Sciscionella marina TaxID=508770 RepID=UPI000373FEBE|nr:hypothetical protein [Sciscionella marina]
METKLRGSFEEQARVLQSSVGAPWLTRNEARARANLPAVANGDELVTPLNVTEGGSGSPRDTAPDPGECVGGTVIRTKDFHGKVKAAGETDGLADGQFTALVSAFGSVDSVGDVVLPGAFTKTLDAWRESADRIPVVWSRNWGDPFSHIEAMSRSSCRS